MQSPWTQPKALGHVGSSWHFAGSAGLGNTQAGSTAACAPPAGRGNGRGGAGNAGEMVVFGRLRNCSVVYCMLHEGKQARVGT
jgi:hypothetical protein